MFQKKLLACHFPYSKRTNYDIRPQLMQSAFLPWLVAQQPLLNCDQRTYNKPHPFDEKGT